MSARRPASRAPRPRIVALVDDRKRDLAGATLLAHQLDALGVECLLEPLEAYRAALAAHRPSLILFNHLNASHLVAYSRRLHAMGVLTAVLPNEGIVYNADQLKFLSNRHHREAHIDYFFCWNEPHRNALREAGFGPSTHIEAVGVPRFDFYKAPWSRLFRASRARGRPRLLLCTNFQLARLWELPKSEADKFFSAWVNRIPLYREYWKTVEHAFLGRQRMLDFADALLAADRYELVVRPHPREDPKPYVDWMAALPAAARRWVRIEATASITGLILECDVEISCETCTTALEAWIAGKPTVELIFFRDPMLYHPEHGAASTPCEDPASLPGAVDAVRAGRVEAAVLAARRALLAKWCSSPDGTSTARVAQLIAQAVKAAPAPDWSKLTAADRRRGTKLRLLRNLGLAYHFDPLMPMKLAFNRDRYAGKHYGYEKAIKPREVAAARAQLVKALGAG